MDQSSTGMITNCAYFYHTIPWKVFMFWVKLNVHIHKVVRGMYIIPGIGLVVSG